MDLEAVEVALRASLHHAGAAALGVLLSECGSPARRVACTTPWSRLRRVSRDLWLPKKQPSSLGAYANAVRDLLEALELPRGTLVGHSLGGGVAMQLAYQYPERCERLALVSSGGLGRELHAMLRAAAFPGAGVVLPWLCLAGRHSVGRMVHALGSLGLRASADLEETWRSFVSLEEPQARQAFLRTVRGLIDRHGQRVSASDRLYLTADLPTLIVWGARDPLIPVRHAHEAHARIEGSRLEILPAAGHFPHRDAPQRLVSAMLDFVEATTPLPADPTRLWRRLRAGPPPSASR